MKKKILSAITLWVFCSLAAFCQEDQVFTGPDFGLSIGERGGTWAETVSVTSPYIHWVKGSYAALRASGDVYVIGGLPVGGAAATWGSYWTARLGAVVKKQMNVNIQGYGNVGGLVLFPTSDVASSTIPGYGLYVDLGVDFFPWAYKFESLFIEVGDECTFTPIGADKFVSAPLMGTGPNVSAGFRVHL